MVAPGDVERVELERSEAVHHRHDRRRLGGQGARRRQQVAGGQEAARGRTVQLDPGGHRPMVRDAGRPAPNGPWLVSATLI